MDSTPEKKSFNALSIMLRSDHRALSKLLARHGSWGRAFQAVGSGVDAERAWEDLSRAGARLILPADAEFPEVIKEIPWTPHALYMKGAALRNDMCMIAIVGT